MVTIEDLQQAFGKHVTYASYDAMRNETVIHYVGDEVWNRMCGAALGKGKAHPYAPEIKGTWFNAPYTTVKWADGSTTTVKCAEDDEYDREKGLLLCFAKRMFGGGRYNDVLRKWMGGDE